MNHWSKKHIFNSMQKAHRELNELLSYVNLTTSSFAVDYVIIFKATKLINFFVIYTVLFSPYEDAPIEESKLDDTKDMIDYMMATWLIDETDREFVLSIFQLHSLKLKDSSVIRIEGMNKEIGDLLIQQTGDLFLRHNAPRLYSFIGDFMARVK